MSEILKKWIGVSQIDETLIRLNNNASMRGRNQANSADINLLYVGTDNNLHLQTSVVFDTQFGSKTILINGSSSGAITMQTGATVTSYSLSWPTAQGGSDTALRNDGSGNLTWVAYANATLSNLGSTAVNAAIVPASNGSISLGASSLRWQNLYLNNAIFDGNGNPAISTANKIMVDNSNVSSVAWSARNLNDTAGTTQLAWATTGVTISTALLPNNDNSIDVGSASKRWANIRAVNTVMYGSTSGTLTHSATATTTSYALTWPSAQGTGALTNNGSGGLSWTPTLSNPMTTLGDIIYENATPVAARLAGNTTTTKNFLTQTGNGTISAAPAWGTIAVGDVPTLNQNTTGTAANITATSNSTLTTLSSLSLPFSQLSGQATLAQLPSIGTLTILGNITGGTATPTALSETQVTSMIQVFTSSLSGAVSASGGGTANFLRADGTWASPGASSGANQTLSNLTSPTAINQDLLPGTADANNLGNSTSRWLNLSVDSISLYNSSSTLQATIGVATTPSGLSGYPSFYSPAGTNIAIFTSSNASSPGVVDIEGGIATGSGSVQGGAITLLTGANTNSGNTNNSGNMALTTGNNAGTSGSAVTGNITLTTGNVTAGSGTSGGITLQTGSSSTGATGAIQLIAHNSAVTAGLVSLQAGSSTGTSTGNGGAATVTAGNTSATGGSGGAVTITAGSATAASGSPTAGTVTLNGGGLTSTSGSSAIAGNITLNAGAVTSATGAGKPGFISINGGNTAGTGAFQSTTSVNISGGAITNAANNNTVGSVTIQAGATASTGSGTAGALVLEAGNITGAANSGVGGSVSISAGANIGTGATTGNGGAVTITSGAPNSGSSTGAGGAISITSGAPAGSGTSGAISIASGSPSGTGQSGTVTISSGGTSGTNPSGAIQINTGASSSTGISGTIEINTGNSSNTSSSLAVGSITITTGQQTAASGTAVGGNISIFPGNVTGAGGGSTGYAQLFGANVTNASSAATVNTTLISGGATSGTGGFASNQGIQIYGGNINNAGNTNIAGMIQLQSGSTTGSGAGGDIQMYTGTTAGTASTGNIIMETAAAASGTGNSGNITIATGNSASAASGAISITAGTAGTTVGGIFFSANGYSFAGLTSGALTFAMPATVTSYTITWPAAQASGTQVLQNNGSGVLSWATASSGANTALSNLTTTSINQDLLPSTTDARNIGSATARWLSISTDAYNVYASGSSTLLGTIGSSTTPFGVGAQASFYSPAGDALAMYTASGAAGTGQIEIETGINSGTTSATSGAVTLRTGAQSSSSATGNSGAVNLVTGNNAGTGASGANSGAVNITTGSYAGTGSSSFGPGGINLTTGNASGATGSFEVGAITLTGGNITGAGGVIAGDVVLNGGNVTNASSSATGGQVQLIAGSVASASSGNPGNVQLVGGAITATTGNTTAGGVQLTGGNTSSTGLGSGGAITITGGAQAGTGATTGNGGNVTIKSGTFNSSTATGQSGTVLIASGSTAGSTASPGSGSVTISTGNVAGTATSGNIALTVGTGGSALGNVSVTANQLELIGTPLSITGTTSGSVSINVPATVSSPYTITLPAAVGATGAILLASNGSGSTEFLTSGAQNQVLMGAGTASVPAWNYPGGNVTAVSSTYSILTSDGFLVLSGASFTITLPTAVGVKCQEYTLKHTGTSIAQQYTIATTSSQTIGGIAGGSYVLMTAQESLTVFSDGSNWQIKQHFTETGPNAYTPTITGVGTATTISFFWERHGALMRIYGAFTSGTVAAALVSLTLPSTAAINSTNLAITANTTSASGAMVGVAKLAAIQSAATQASVVTAPGTSTTLVYVGAGSTTSQFIPANGNATGTVFVSASITQFDFSIPITNFQP